MFGVSTALTAGELPEFAALAALRLSPFVCAGGPPTAATNALVLAPMASNSSKMR